MCSVGGAKEQEIKYRVRIRSCIQRETNHIASIIDGLTAALVSSKSSKVLDLSVFPKHRANLIDTSERINHAIFGVACDFAFCIDPNGIAAVAVTQGAQIRNHTIVPFKSFVDIDIGGTRKTVGRRWLRYRILRRTDHASSIVQYVGVEINVAGWTAKCAQVDELVMMVFIVISIILRSEPERHCQRGQ